MPFVACKLPHGIIINHNDVKITLRGHNIGERLLMPSPNGEYNDHENRYCGYGLTELSPEQADAFESWYNHNLYKNGNKASGRLAQPYKPISSGAVTQVFKTLAELKKELSGLSSMSGIIKTGMEGLNPNTPQKGITRAEKE